MKQLDHFAVGKVVDQPPSGGCVLKHDYLPSLGHPDNQPPSGGCVLKLKWKALGIEKMVPAAFRRLCVETTNGQRHRRKMLSSRLQAAVC